MTPSAGMLIVRVSPSSKKTLSELMGRIGRNWRFVFLGIRMGPSDNTLYIFLYVFSGCLYTCLYNYMCVINWSFTNDILKENNIVLHDEPIGMAHMKQFLNDVFRGHPSLIRIFDHILHTCMYTYSM